MWVWRWPVRRTLVKLPLEGFPFWRLPRAASLRVVQLPGISQESVDQLASMVKISSRAA
ncbi:unnamed protein product [Durusdinium trenchii]|uniref:Uncharacterized protein n=2 Tax=Durusdinium trenchii TaxID=1381693 RepID=A0ABP0J1V6_9DINO